jgi:hypothetical protein
LAASVVVVYSRGEQDLIAQSGQFIREAIQAPPNSPPRYMLYSRLQRAAQQVSAGIRMQVAGMAQTVADTAARNGNATAAREVRKYAEKYRLSGNVLDLLPHNVNSARMVADDLSKRLDAAAVRITRFADDAYRAAVVSGAVTQVLDNATPVEAAAQAWRELSARGVTGFTDKSGRNWNLASYVEMATRTATQRAYNASHRDRLTQAGINYFTISTTGRPCPLCAPWEGKVLADAGAGIASEPSAADSTQTVTFAVSATIEEATAAGLFHPNCKHVLTSYLPGVTTLRTNGWMPEDEQAYKNTQQLRALENEVRKAKMQAAGAVTDMDKRRANARARELQARIRDHTAATGLLRRPGREQISLGYKP